MRTAARYSNGDASALVARRVVARSGDAEERLQAADVDLVRLDELIRRAPGARRISSIDALRCGAFDTAEELAFLAFVSESRHGAGGAGGRTWSLAFRSDA